MTNSDIWKHFSDVQNKSPIPDMQNNYFGHTKWVFQISEIKYLIGFILDNQWLFRISKIIVFDIRHNYFGYFSPNSLMPAMPLRHYWPEQAHGRLSPLLAMVPSRESFALPFRCRLCSTVGLLPREISGLRPPNVTIRYDTKFQWLTCVQNYTSSSCRQNWENINVKSCILGQLDHIIISYKE